MSHPCPHCGLLCECWTFGQVAAEDDTSVCTHCDGIPFADVMEDDDEDDDDPDDDDDTGGCWQYGDHL